MDVHDKWGEEMSDLIEREDAIEVAYQLRRKPNDEEWNWWLRSFNAIPSADRPRGEWIDRGMRVPSSWVKKCSLCGYETDTWRWCNFCPNCGAKMKGADDDTPVRL